MNSSTASSSSSSSSAPSSSSGSSSSSTEPVIRFRNYRPSSDALKPQVVAPVAAPSIALELREREETAQLVAAHHQAARGVAAGPASSATASSRTEASGGDGAGGDDTVLTIAPKKPNWDLKRNIEGRLATLEKQTKRAITEIVRERLSAEAAATTGQESSSTAATASSSASNSSSSSSMAGSVRPVASAGFTRESELVGRRCCCCCCCWCCAAPPFTAPEDASL